MPNLLQRIGNAIMKLLGFKEAQKQTEKNFSPKKEAGNPTQTCPLQAEKEKPRIVSIIYLDGDDATALSGEGPQWVNFPREAKWVDAPRQIRNQDRLSQKVRYKVAFNKPGAHAFKVRGSAAEGNLQYTGGEKGRNANFKWQEQEKSYTTNGDGTKIVETDFFTTCGGGDGFKLKATDDYGSPPVETGVLKVRRAIYLVVVKMRGKTVPNLDAFKGEFRNQAIEIFEVPQVEIDPMPNIGPAEENTYKTRCRQAFESSTANGKKPYAVALGVTEHLAVKNPDQTMEMTGVEVGPGKAPVEVPIMARGLRSGDGMRARALWKDLVPGEGWFVSCTFTPSSGGAERVIAQAACTPLPEGAAYCPRVRVDVTGLAAATGTLKLKVHVVDRMRAGLSFSGGNLICICNKAWWADISEGEQNSTAVHELGHKVWMVCDGTGKLPDRVATHYEGKGHVGAHCHFGLPVQDTYAGASGNGCVMFGAVAPGAPTAFCENCAPAVKKMDLSDGWNP